MLTGEQGLGIEQPRDPQHSCSGILEALGWEHYWNCHGMLGDVPLLANSAILR